MKYKLALLNEAGEVLLEQDFDTQQDLDFDQMFIEIGEHCQDTLNLNFCHECGVLVDHVNHDSLCEGCAKGNKYIDRKI